MRGLYYSRDQIGFMRAMGVQFETDVANERCIVDYRRSEAEMPARKEEIKRTARRHLSFACQPIPRRCPD
jgi:hypothetical protein